MVVQTIPSAAHRTSSIEAFFVGTYAMPDALRFDLPGELSGRLLGRCETGRPPHATLSHQGGTSGSFLTISRSPAPVARGCLQSANRPLRGSPSNRPSWGTPGALRVIS
jgi:hypothetical protein